MKKPLRDLLTNIVNEQGKLNIRRVSNSISRKTNEITSIVNVGFKPKDHIDGIIMMLPFTLSFDEDDPAAAVTIHFHQLDRTTDTVVSGVVYGPSVDELSSPKDLPDVIKSKYRPSFLPKIFENYQYIVEIAKKLETHKGTM